MAHARRKLPPEALDIPDLARRLKLTESQVIHSLRVGKTKKLAFTKITTAR